MSISIVPIVGTDIRFVPGEWPLPQDLRDSVPERWAAQLAANPHLWDGRVLGVGKVAVGEDGILRGEAREEAFSTFLAWREVGFPDVGVQNLFGSALIVSSDRQLIFGLMGDDTANAGRIYPPGGSLEPRDVLPDGRVDVARSTQIELMEETGLEASLARLGRMVAVIDGPRISVGTAFHFDATADELLRAIRANLDLQEHRELADVVALRTSADAEGKGRLMAYAAALVDACHAGTVTL
jgi:8-oxo-dGTP pyrophosphatase MutT (NUDIX family)